MRARAFRQRGVIAIIVGLSLLVLVGFAGLVLDLGRLFVNKSELQSAADACALAAAAELTCDPAQPGACTAAYLLNAESAGLLVASRNNRDFQNGAVNILADDVRFSTSFVPNSAYLSRAGGASPASKYAMCIARATGIVPWFMGVFGAQPASVDATAVATLAPSQNFCSVVPLGLCSKPGGYAVGEWAISDFTSSGNDDGLDGNFRWVDFTPNAGGNNEIREQLAGVDQVCNITIGAQVQQPGTQQGAKSAYNTRFGLYPNGANAYAPATSPPDRSGYAYPNKAPGSPVIGVGDRALADHQARQGVLARFSSAEYGVSGPGGNIADNNPASDAEMLAYGAERRLVTVPLIDCAAGNTVTVLDMACVLMLNPMSNGASGRIYLEYEGPAGVSSPCRTSGTPGGNGPLVPVLVQ